MVAGEVKWLAGAVLAGGVAAPVLLMLGLAAMPASSASLLLNAEAVFTALLAWFVFKENVNARVALGMCAIVAGGLLLAWPGTMNWPGWQPALFVVAACFAWGLDNNLTRKVSLGDASWIAMVKGLAAGTTNLALAFFLGASWPALPVVLAAGLVGFASYGASLALFIVGLRELGTARTGAYFSVAPFFGALLAIALLGEPITGALIIAGDVDGHRRGPASVGAARTPACARGHGAYARACARERCPSRPRACARRCRRVLATAMSTGISRWFTATRTFPTRTTGTNTDSDQAGASLARRSNHKVVKATRAKGRPTQESLSKPSVPMNAPLMTAPRAVPDVQHRAVQAHQQRRLGRRQGDQQELLRRHHAEAGHSPHDEHQHRERIVAAREGHQQHHGGQDHQLDAQGPQGAEVIHRPAADDGSGDARTVRTSPA